MSFISLMVAPCPFQMTYPDSWHSTRFCIGQVSGLLVISTTLSDACNICTILTCLLVVFFSDLKWDVRIICPHRHIFCDFGQEFVVSDVDGEQPLSCMIADIELVSRVTSNCFVKNSYLICLSSAFILDFSLADLFIFWCSIIN